MRRGLPASITALLLSLACAGVTACSSGSAGVVPDRTDHAADAGDGFAPPSATPLPGEQAPDESRGLARDAASRDGAEATPSPAATSGPPGSHPRPAVTTGTGTAAAASQPTGRGYVDTLTENRLPGTPGWRTVPPPGRAMIEGYADAVSAVAGQRVRLFVSTTARTFRVQLLRLGWYGGVGARQVWLSDPLPGGPQPAPRVDATTHLIVAGWTPSVTVPTVGLVAGSYLAKLLGSDGASSFVPLTVREPLSAGAVLMLNSTLTWLAYNDWGGANTYRASDPATTADGYARRSVVTSFDRPFRQGSGSGGLLDDEEYLIAAAERLGLRLNYAADVDLQVDPEVLQGATGVALLGHSEYWSRPMRAALTAARDRGANLAFLGANDIYRRVRLQASGNGPARLMTNYKDGAADPVTTQDTTADWPHGPHPEPEQPLTGVEYRCARTRADLVIVEPDGWLFRGLGVSAGQRLPGMVGSETDRVVPGLPTSRPLQIMAHSPTSCYGYLEWSDLVWYSAPSGAGVFAAGTLDWSRGLVSSDAITRSVVVRVTERVFLAIAQPRAGRAIPAVDNVNRFYGPPGVARATPPDAHPVSPPRDATHPKVPTANN
ncbi:MAG TPA: N,N-dimethylformamidase beta subunit family domain-containing protein [Kineosporiaceae bacterium]